MRHHLSSKYSKLALITLSLSLLLSGTGQPNGVCAKTYSPELVEKLQQGDLAMSQGRLKDAQELFEQCIQMDPECVHAHNQLGLTYSRQNRLPEAAGQMTKALEIDPNFECSLINLGVMLYRQNNYSGAIPYYERALKLKGGKDAELLTNLGCVYRDRASFDQSAAATRDQDFKQAIKCYKDAIALDPSFSQAHNNLGLCYVRLHQFEDGEREIKKAIELKPDYATAYYNLGLTLQKMKRSEEAYRAYQNSLRYESVPAYAEGTRRKMAELGVAPTQTIDHFSHGYDMLSRKRWIEAEKEFKIVVNETKGLKNAIAWNNLGLAQSKQGKYADAVKSFRHAIALMKNGFPAAEYNMGQALRLSGDLIGAEEAYTQAIDHNDGLHALAHNALGIILRQRKEYSQSLEEYKKAIAQSGNTLPVVHYNIALLLETQGKVGEAIDYYEEYLKQARNGANVEAAKSHIARLKR